MRRRGRALSEAAPALLLLAVLLNNLIWAVALPYNSGPDELDHFELAKYIHGHAGLPVLGRDLPYYLMDATAKRPVKILADPGTGRRMAYFDPAHVFELRTPYDRMPPLPYIFSALSMGLVPADNPKGNLLGARLIPALCGAGLALMCWLACAALWPDRRERALAAAAVAGLVPMSSFISGYVNADSFAAFAAAFALASAFRGERNGWRRNDSMLLGLALCAVAMSRLSAYVVMPLCLLPLAAAGINRSAKIRHLMWAGLPAAAMGGAWHLRNYLLYGDPMGLGREAELRRELVASLPSEVAERTWNLVLTPLAQRGYGLGILWDSSWFSRTFASVFGEFGWRDIRLPEPIYLVALGFVLLAAAGWIRGMAIRRAGVSVDRGRLLPAAILALTFLGCLGMSIYRTMYHDWQPQGRYLAPALLPLALFAAGGVESAFGSERARRVALRLLFYFVLAVNQYSLYALIIPFYLKGTPYAP